MAELLVKLPETLYNQLGMLAQKEGVSLTQYILYSLAHQVETSYRVERISREEVQRQAEEIVALRARWQEITSEKDLDQLLAAREIAEPELELTPELVGKIKARIAAARNLQKLSSQ